MTEEPERKRHRDDPEEVKQILQTVSTEILKLIRSVMDSLFSPEAGGNLGKAVAEFYKQLKDSGVPPEEAMAMAKDYLGTLTNWSKMIKDVNIGNIRTSKKDEHKEEGE